MCLFHRFQIDNHHCCWRKDCKQKLWIVSTKFYRSCKGRNQGHSRTAATQCTSQKLAWASSVIFFICNLSYSLLTFVPPTSCETSCIRPARTYFWSNIISIEICAGFLTFGTAKIIFLIFTCIAFLWKHLFNSGTVALESKLKLWTYLNGIFALIEHF